MSTPTNATIEAETISFGKWQRLAELEEKYLQQRAKLHWLEVGDRNNAYFLRSAQLRRMINTISEITTPNGEVLTKQEEIKTEAVRFYEDFYNQEPAELDIMPIQDLQQLLNFRCSEENNNMLIKEVTEEEIKKVIFSMPCNKSPRPDGYTSEFFKGAWNIVEKMWWQQ